jgi:predicted Fe-Mo cluster-binding NifX family protein
MNAAFACWNNRIAPVFDSARQVLLVRVESGRVAGETLQTLPDDLPVQKALRLAELGVGTLVCGAISRPLHAMVSAYGIRIVPFVAGDLREIIRAWLQGGLAGDTFAMPGCTGRGRRRLQAMQDVAGEEWTVNARGMGGGHGMGAGRGPGRMGGRKMAGPAGMCICPNCGTREPHRRGVPCSERKCPQCGTLMTRE